MKNIFLSLLFLNLSAFKFICMQYHKYFWRRRWWKTFSTAFRGMWWKKELKLLYEKPLKVQVCGKDILLEKVGRVLYLNGPVNQIIIQAPRKEIFLTGDLWFRSSLEIGSFLL